MNYDNILQTLKITNNMNDDMLLDAQKSINRLETDLPNGLNSTSYTKPAATKEENSLDLPKAECSDSVLCNGRGYCYNVEVMSFCSCKANYTGRYCQLSDKNYETLNDFSSRLSEIITYNLVNNTDFSAPNAITNKEIEALNLGFNTDSIISAPTMCPKRNII